MMAPDPAEKWARFPQVADTTLRNLASDYLSITRIAGNSDALGAVFFPPPEYDPKTLADLGRVADNIVELDLSDISVGGNEIDAIATFANLERLELDRTPVGDTEVRKLSSLKNLQLLKIYGTAITDESILTFKDLPNLKSLYLWDTG